MVPDVQIETNTQTTSYVSVLGGVVSGESGLPAREEENLGFGRHERSRVSELLGAAGLWRKAQRYIDCEFKGGRWFCGGAKVMFDPALREMRPVGEEHKYFFPFRCGLRFCQPCSPRQYREMLQKYIETLVVVMDGLPPRRDCVLARINFTIRATGEFPTSGGIKDFNSAMRRTLWRVLPKGEEFGALMVDEVGYEKRGHIRNRVAGGLNLHAHGLYYGPYLDWEQVRDAWIAETRGGGRGFWVQEIKGWRLDPAQGIRRALGHMFKYVSKVPAETAERVAGLEIAFHGTRRVHTFGQLFYGKVAQVARETPAVERGPCVCPLDGSELVREQRGKFELISVLKAQGYRSLEEVQEEVRRQRTWGAAEGFVRGPPEIQ